MKRTRSIVSMKASVERIVGGALLVGLTIILFIALLGLVSTPALAKGKGHHVVHPRACSKTATAAFLACYNEKKDDYWIAQGNCYNSAEEDQAECFQEAKAEYKDAKAECQDQLDARKDLCDELGEAPYDPPIDEIQWVNPERISAGTANPYFPLVRGYKWVYKTYDEDGMIIETNTDEVLMETKEIMGVKCFVVHDIVYGGNNIDPDKIKEDTYDYYAQDFDGNVWYFGEFSLSFEEDLPSMEGSWLFGVDDAKPGVIMFADPSAKLETVYRQEFALGDAEDWAKLESPDAEVSNVLSPIGNCVVGRSNCIGTAEGTPLEPDVIEHKFYKPGFGTVLETTPDNEKTELVRINFTPSP